MLTAMTVHRLKQISKFLSLVLRHKPEEADVHLDNRGWAEVNELLEACAARGFVITRQELELVVVESDKQRFELSSDRRRIRAMYGHSITVDLGYERVEPPDTLFHGTAEHSLASVREHGLVSARRQYVHLSPDAETAVKVGQRHGRPVVLSVQAHRMHRDGYSFYHAPSGVWLTDYVPPEYVSFLSNE